MDIAEYDSDVAHVGSKDPDIGCVSTDETPDPKSLEHPLQGDGEYDSDDTGKKDVVLLLQGLLLSSFIMCLFLFPSVYCY